MTEKHSKIFKIIYLVTFIILNICNIFLLTFPNVIENIIPYKITIYMAISSFIGNLSCLAIMLALGLLIFKKKKTLYRYIFICTTVISIILFILSVTCNYYGMMFCFDNLANFNLVNSGDSAYFFIDTIPNTIKFSVPLFLIPAIVYLGAYLIYSIKLSKTDENYQWNIKKQKKMGLIILLVSLVLLIGVNVSFNIKNNNTWYEYNTTPLYNAQSTGLLNHIVDEFGNLIFGKKKLDEQDKEEALEQLVLLKQDPDGTNEYTGIFKDKNLLLIQLESFNDFLVGLEVLIDGEYVEVTPNINKLVQENIYFDNFYTSTGIGNTSDAEMTAMTGLYPTGGSYAIYKYDDHEFQTLPEMFRKLGYTSISTHGNDSKFYTRNHVHTNMFDFDEHLGGESLKVTEENMVHRWIGDVDLLKQTIDKMNESEKSFGYAITITNHTPYMVPLNGTDEKWFSCKDNLLPVDYQLSTNNRYNKIYTGYLEYVSYTDYAIGEAIEYLKEKGMYEDTVIIIYGDHGIDSPFYNVFYDYPEKFRNDINPLITNNHDNQKLYEYEFINNVPFIIANPILKSKKISLTRSNTTIQSTICNLFGLEQEYYFSIDALSDKQDIALTTKTELIFYDGIVMSFASENYIVTSDKWSIDEKLLESLLKKYQQQRDLNDKILENDLLRK